MLTLLIYILATLSFANENGLIELDPGLIQTDIHSYISPDDVKYNIRSPYRWLVPKDHLIEGPGVDFNLDDDGPDFWDVVAWLGTQVGRAVRVMCNAIVRLSKAIYVGIMYGWNEGRATSTPTE